jgi:fluoride exporter
MLKNFLLVGLGGGIGSIFRYASHLIFSSRQFPISTLLVNILGSFIIGLVFAYSIKAEGIGANWKLFLATGICGGFTTFSAFSMENVQLLLNGKYGAAGVYIIASMVTGILAALLGFKLLNH